ncbi:hypothetical protein DFW101_3488 [Solidesulfovibrio carbinoliphilus subsp. oakridgensis]|uniref:Uncharacterized protein n=1 Tax=Solidesulfovibrio carbinoliphilus subsp. oakridgensis TaxID=694327 RepID=G7QC40_9BACT|nr:hypothetical protein [Solidesulfovibrio carbinoliphilus]EHJ49486.1 hypothetical protein DFW101_3488 [Solidesulfovibrio carbinoliphilus subsp. oakridgensis]
MKLIVPKQITADTIVSYNVVENDYDPYNSATLYLVGQRVIDNHKIYQALVGDSITGISAWASGTAYAASNLCYLVSTHKIYQANKDTTGQQPDNYLTGESPVWTEVGSVNQGVVLTDTNFWIELGPTNYYAMLDNYTDTQTTGVAVTGGNAIIIELDSSKCNAVALFNCVGSYIDMECLSADDTVVWSSRVWLILRDSKSWSDFFFSTQSKTRKDTYQQFPMFYNTRLRLTIFSPETAKCGDVVIGATKNIGSTKFNPTLSIIDYSKKETNSFGVTYLSVGKYKKKTSIDMYVRNKEIDTVYRTLADLRATPAVFICDNSTTATEMYESMLVKGFYTDFSIVVPGPSMSDCSLEIEGLA